MLKIFISSFKFGIVLIELLFNEIISIDIYKLKLLSSLWYYFHDSCLCEKFIKRTMKNILNSITKIFANIC